MTDIDTGTDHFLASVEDGVAVLTMNRPERRNALSPQMLEAFARVLADVERDPDVGAVVLTGAGGAFCAGGDVKAMAENNALFGPGASYDTKIQLQQLSQRATTVRLWSMPKPTIAAIPGAAAGAGLSLALACDLRYAADTSVFTTAFAKVGFSGDYGGTWLLTQLVGPAKAKELYFFADRFGAEEAVRLGIVNDVFSADKVLAEAVDRARRLADGPRIALRYMKANLNRAIHDTLANCSDLEVVHHAYTATTADHREAAQAFVEKREPKFTGR